jgi:hypothetical protein
MQMYQMLCTGYFPLKFMVQRFSGKIALKHYKGHYVLAKKTSSIFQFDTNNRMLEYLDEFTIIGHYKQENFSDQVFGTRIFNSHGLSESEKQNEILLKTMQRFLEMKIFSVMELQVARKIAYNKNITRKQLAKDFKISITTISTYYNRFLGKARTFFNRDFPSAEVAAKYLKNEGLL